jgi:predicted RNase H-like HicB family nuclease
MVKYPARYKKESDAMYFLEFIDFPGAMTSAESMKELHDNAQDVLSLAIKYSLNRDIDIPGPSEVDGNDVIMVEPSPEVRQRMGHKKGCDCPMCRTARGERKQTKTYCHHYLDAELVQALRDVSKKEKIPMARLVEDGVRYILAQHS